MATVYIPSLLRDLTGGQDKVAIPGSTLRQIIAALDVLYPGIKDRLCEGEGLRRGISVAVDSNLTNVGLLQAVGENSEVHFLPAISGG